MGAAWYELHPDPANRGPRHNLRFLRRARRFASRGASLYLDEPHDRRRRREARAALPAAQGGTAGKVDKPPLLRLPRPGGPGKPGRGIVGYPR